MKYTRENLKNFIHSEMKNKLENSMFSEYINNEIIFLEKKYSWGYDETSLPRIAFLETHLEFGINISRRYSVVEELWQDCAELIQINYTDVNSISTIVVNHGNASEEIKTQSYYDGSLRFEISEKGLAEIPDAIDFVMNKILEKLNLFRDLKNVDQLINNEIDPPIKENEIFWKDGAFMFKRMILAKLTGNDTYEEICDLYKSRFSKIVELAKTPGKEFFLNYPIVFEKVYERLKDIKPLDNTILPT